MGESIDTDEVRDQINAAALWEMRAWIAQLLPELDATRTERDEAQMEFADALRSRDELVEALHRNGRHDPECWPDDCVCGLAVLLDRYPRPERDGGNDG